MINNIGALLSKAPCLKQKSLPHVSVTRQSANVALFSTTANRLSPSKPQPEILTLALSGPSTSGKSSLSYLLQTLLCPSPAANKPSILPTPPVHILADDFMLDDHHLPRSQSGRFLDAETPSSIDMDGLLKTLRYVQDPTPAGGQGIGMPDHFLSWQSLDLPRLRRQATTLVGGREVVDDLAMLLAETVGEAGLQKLRVGHVRLVTLDGFLLFHDPELRSLCDLKILLRLSKAEAKRRRGLKPGFWNNRSAVDKDGMGNLVGLGPDFGKVDFWRLEAYFEECVWSGWENGIGWLFTDRDVEGAIDPAAEKEDIKVGELNMSPRKQAEWVIGHIGRWLQGALETKDV